MHGEGRESFPIFFVVFQRRGVMEGLRCDGIGPAQAAEGKPIRGPSIHE